MIAYIKEDVATIEQMLAALCEEDLVYSNSNTTESTSPFELLAPFQ